MATVPSTLKIPQGPRTAPLGRPGLETIPASPLSPATMRSLPTPNLPRFPLTPSTTPRMINRRGIQQLFMGEDVLRAPRPLSERAMILLDPTKARHPQSPLSPLGVSPPLSASGSTARESEKSPLARSPLRRSVSPATPAGSSSKRPPFARGITETMKRPPTTPTWPQSKANTGEGERRRPRPQLSVDSLRAQAGEGTDSDDDGERFGAGAPSPRTVMESQSRRTENGGSGNGIGTPLRMPPHVRCYMCPDFCTPGMGLCDECQKTTRDLDREISDSSSYESINVRTPDLSLSPRKTKPMSIPATPRRTSRRRSNTNSPKTPRTPPLGWSRKSPSQQLHPDRGSSEMSSLSGSPTPQLAQQLKVFPSPALPQRVSIVASPTSPSSALARNRSWSGSERGSALWHLERNMKYDNDWQPLMPGAPAPEWSSGKRSATETIRVGSVQSGEGRRVIHVRDSNAEDADTMKMLADENLEPCYVPAQGERRHEAGGGYGDWFSYYAHKKGNKASSSGYVDDASDPYSSSIGSSLSCGLFCSLPNRDRDSSASSIYDRIQSIYDVYAELPGEHEEVGGNLI